MNGEQEQRGGPVDGIDWARHLYVRVEAGRRSLSFLSFRPAFCLRSYKPLPATSHGWIFIYLLNFSKMLPCNSERSSLSVSIRLCRGTLTGNTDMKMVWTGGSVMKAKFIPILYLMPQKKVMLGRFGWDTCPSWNENKIMKIYDTPYRLFWFAAHHFKGIGQNSKHKQTAEKKQRHVSLLSSISRRIGSPVLTKTATLTLCF